MLGETREVVLDSSFILKPAAVLVFGWLCRNSSNTWNGLEICIAGLSGLKEVVWVLPQLKIGEVSSLLSKASTITLGREEELLTECWTC